MSDEHDVRPVAQPVVSSGGFLFSDPRAWLPIVLLLALAAGLAYYARTLDAQNDALQRRLDAALEDTATSREIAANAEEATEAVHRTMAIVTAADMIQLNLSGQSAAPSARARVFWSRQHGLVFTSTNLPPVPKGKIYQVWVLSAENAPFSAGLLTPNEDGAATVIYSTPRDIAPPTGFAVSLESGEAAAPTSTAIYLIGDLRR
jgi:Anti-sigma-K factor rskA